MSNRTKIIIVVLIIIAIIVSIVGIIGKGKTKEQNKVKNEDNINILFQDYVDEKNETTDEIENIVENDVIENEVVNEESENNVGKEEQESNKENAEITDKEKAIQLAKNEWAISVDSYDFQADKKTDGTYEVTIRNKTDRNTVAIYLVDVKSETVKDMTE